MLSGSIRAWPEIKGHTAESWALLKAWSNLEVVCRATPMPPLACMGFIHIRLQLEEFAAAFLFALGMDSFLQAGELIKLCPNDVHYPRNGGRGTMRLRDTKTSRASGVAEVLTINDPIVWRLFKVGMLARPKDMSPDIPFWWDARDHMARLFDRAALLQGVSALGLRIHSLCKGGATAYFRRIGDLSRTI